MSAAETSIWSGHREFTLVLSDVNDVWRALRRSLPALMLWMLLCTASGLLYVHVVQPQYVATVNFALQPRRVVADGPEKVRAYRQFMLDGRQADTEIELIRSEQLLRRVFVALDLAQSPALQRGYDGVWPALFGILHRLATRSADQDRDAAAFGRFVDHVRARREALSYVIEVSYVSPDPELSARVANAIVSAYLQSRLERARAVVREPYLDTWADRQLSQSLVTSDAMASGNVPAHLLPDTGVRLLDSATPPRGRAYPKTGPVLMVSAAFALTSGLFAALALNRGRRRIRTPGQISDLLGLVCLGVLAASPWSRGARGSSRSVTATPRARFGQAMQAALGQDSVVRSLAFASWTGEGARAAATQAAAHRAALGEASRLLVIEADQSEHEILAEATVASDDRSTPMTLLVLPPLRTLSSATGMLGAVDQTVLVAETHRTTVAQVAAARAAVRAAQGRLMGILLVDAGRFSGRFFHRRRRLGRSQVA